MLTITVDLYMVLKVVGVLVLVLGTYLYFQAIVGKGSVREEYNPIVARKIGDWMDEEDRRNG